MTVAAVDRLVDHSTIIQINSESYRRKRARRLSPDQASITRQPSRKGSAVQPAYVIDASRLCS